MAHRSKRHFFPTLRFKAIFVASGHFLGSTGIVGTPLFRRLYCATIPLRLASRGWLAWLTHGLYALLHPKTAVDGRPKRVLVVARDALALSHGRVLIECLAKEADWEFHLTGPARLLRDLRDGSSGNPAAVPTIGFLRALRRQWDLVCFPSHHHAGLFHPSIPRLFTAHGLEAGRIMYGGSGYTYGWKAMGDLRRCAYSGFLATSLSELQLARHAGYFDAIEGKITVTTEPVALKLLSEASNPRPRRSNDRINVLFMSTWVSNSLLERHGGLLLERLRDLGDRYKVRLSVHPRWYRRSDIHGLLRSMQAIGVEVVPPEPDAWIPGLLATDLAIGDVTALALYFSLLGRPMMFLAPKPVGVLPDSLLFELFAICPKLDLTKDLAPQFEALISSKVASSIREFSAARFPHIDDRARLTAYLRSTMENRATVQ